MAKSIRKSIADLQNDFISDKQPHRRFSHSKKNAKERGYEWKISFRLFKELISKPCSFCGELKIENGSGLDRINQLIGYLPTNVIPCCYICNMMKRMFPDWMFIDQVKKIYRNLRKR